MAHRIDSIAITLDVYDENVGRRNVVVPISPDDKEKVAIIEGWWQEHYDALVLAARKNPGLWPV